MEEKGIVVEEKGSTVMIRTDRKSSCDSCATKSLCQGIGESDMLIEAENLVGAHVGDHVVVTVGAASVLKAGVLLYLVPVLSFILGLVLGQTVVAAYFPRQNPDLVSGVLGAVFLLAAFVGLKLYNRTLEKGRTHMPRVLRVV